MRIPINVGIKGRVTATLTNTETGEKQEVKGDNLILDHYMDLAMERGLGILGTETFNRCYIGYGSTPPQPTDTTFNGTQLAMSASSALVKDLTPLGQVVEDVKIIENMGVSNENSLAITPDGEILVVASDGTDFPGLRAFLVNEDYTLTSLQVADFEEFENVLCKNLAIGGKHLFVGLGAAPWGKLYKRVGNTFEFVSDVPELGDTKMAYLSDSGEHLVVGLMANSTTNVRYYIIENGLIEIIAFSFVGTDNTQAVRSLSISPDGTFFSCFKDSRLFRCTFDGETITQHNMPTYSYRGGLICTNNREVYAYVNHSNDLTKGFGKWLSDGSWNVIHNLALPSSGRGSDNLLKYCGDMLITGSLWVKGFKDNHIIHFNPDISMLPNDSLPLAGHENVIFTAINAISPGSLSIYKIRAPKSSQSYARQWTFPAGTGTGTVNRVGLQANSSTGSGGYDRHVAQIVLPEPLEKTDLHQLDVIWEIEVENPVVWEGVIPGGSRDGSDLAWRVTINEEQFYNLVQTGYSIPANWFGVTGTPNVRIGTSNEESDLIFDWENIRGEQIEYISSTAIRVVNPYVPGSLKRTIRLFLEVNQGNGQIGEMVLGGSESVNSLARITFDPPLDKPPDVGEGANPYRIYLDLEIGWQRG